MSKYTKVKGYTDKQIFDRAESIPGFNGFPSNKWIGCIRSNEDTPDIYDDKAYIYEGRNFLDVMTCTTNPGVYGLKNFKDWDKRGVAIIKADEWYYDVWNVGMHKGKVKALVQNDQPFKLYRDNNMNNKSGDVPKDSWTLEYYRGINFHPNTYNLDNTSTVWNIGQWSTGCVVVNDRVKYKKFINSIGNQKKFTLLMLDEF